MLVALAQLMSCKKDKDDPEVIASFTFTVDATDFKKVTFTNASTNFSKVEWNFGDNSAVSTETNPVHTYAAVGEFTVTLTATSLGGGQTDVRTEKVTIADPNAELTKLVGDTEKTWKLLRDISTGRYPLEVGPENYSTIWWAMGLNNPELSNRPCMLNDEWTFTRTGQMKFRANGDYWAEGGIFNPANICASTDQMVGPAGEDLSSWGDGDHTFEYTPGSTPTLKVNGLGAYIGLCKLGNSVEVKLPQESVTYNVVKLTDDNVDTLIVEGIYRWGEPTGGYWRFVLVHYDNPDDEPPIPGNQPSAGFSLSFEGLTVTCTNTSTSADSYLWEFGDGQTSTLTSPTHTYANGGIYTIKLTATNANGSSTISQFSFVSVTTLTDDLLKGGAWKVRAEDNSIFVGPALGSSAWWSCPKAFLDGTNAGTTDDWSCLPDDEFAFANGGVFTYDTKGSARNDGYMGTPNGCFTDEQIAASGNGAAFGSATHSYEFIPASKSGKGRPVILLTNGAGKAAFIGFYKGYYGGENIDGVNPPNGGNSTNKYEVMGYANNGTKEYLFVSVDLTPDHTGGSAWSIILER